MKHRWIAVLLSLAMVLSYLPGIPVFAQEVTETQGLTEPAAQQESAPVKPEQKAITGTLPSGFVYSISNEEVTITDYTGTDTDLVIPDRIEGYPVTEIASSAFSYCETLCAVTIPDTVTDVESWAFGGCRNLTTVTLCDKVSYISSSAFYECNVKELIVAEGSQSITYDMVVSPYTLESVTIPATVTQIDTWAFSNCYMLNAVHIQDLGAWCAMNFESYENPLANHLCLNGEPITQLVIPQGVTAIGQAAFASCKNLTSVTIPNSVTSIGPRAFYGCEGLTSVTIPDSVTSIGDQGFYGCRNMKELKLGNGLREIGEGAFGRCDGLSALRIPAGVTRIGDYAFCDALETVNITDLAAWCAITFEGSGANPMYYAENVYLNGEPLTQLVIPQGVTKIGAYAFYNGENLTAITIPASVKEIGKYAFTSCSNVEAVNIQDLAAWCQIRFENEYANPLYFADALCLNGAPITDLVIPEGVTQIGDYAFYNYRALKSLSIPSSVTAIGKRAFYYCRDMDISSLGSGLRVIGEYAFFDCDGITEITIPQSVTEIGAHAFRGCSKLTAITIGKGVQQIGTEAFQDTMNLTGIRVDPQNAHYCADAYGVLFDKNMTTLIQAPAQMTGSYDIPAGVVRVTDRSFYDFDRLTEITIPASVTELGKETLRNCDNLTGIRVDKNNETYCSDGYGVLFDKNMTTLIQAPGKLTGQYLIPAGVTQIAEYAFSSCEAITAVTIPGTVTAIGTDAFAYCDDLGWIVFTGDAPNISGGDLGWVQTVIYYPEGNGTWTEDVIRNLSYGDTVCYPYTPQQLEGQWMYQIRDGKVTVTGYSGTQAHITVPATLEDCPVTAIGEKAFMNHQGLASVILPAGLTEIQSYAFYNCENLVIVKFQGDCPAVANDAFDGVKAVAFYPARRNTWTSEHFDSYGGNLTWRAYDEDLQGILASGETEGFTWTLTDQGQLQISGQGDMPESQWKGYGLCILSVSFSQGITGIGDSAFYDCVNLKEITIPDTVTTIAGRAFYNCDSLTEIVIPQGVTGIGQYAFAYCNDLREITIPATVTRVETDAFRSSSNLQKVHISDLAAWCAISFANGWRLTDNFSNPLYYADGLYLNGKLVTELVIPSGVTAIGTVAFYNYDKLTSVTIADSVTQIGDYAFAGCDQLSGLWVGTKNKNYTSNKQGVLFNKDKTRLLQAPGNLQGSYTVPSTVTEIGDYAFCQCAGLTRVQLPAALETLGTGAFYACTGLAALSIPEKVTYLGAYICYQCTGLQSVSLPDGVSSIGERAFYDCSALTQIVLPQTVSSIGEYAFYSCENLTQITIPENVSYIWERAFAYCESLQSISLGNRLTYVDDGVFAACYSLTSVVIPDSVTAIRDSAFSSCENLISVVISENVASIGSSAFGYCEKLRAITFGGYPATISDFAFTEVSATAYYPAQNSNWTAQTMRNYGGTLTWTAYQVGEETVIASGSCGDDVKWTLGIYGTLHISGTGAMSDGYIWQKEESGEQYRNLVRNVVIGQGVTTIGSGAFNSCNLTGVTIPDTVTKIGDRAFAYCDSLTQIVIPDSVTTIGDSAFYFCDRLTQVTLPANLTAIGQQMFYGCKSLTCLTVPGLVKTIGESAFCQCESLTEISISAAVADIAAGAFAGCKNLQTIVVDEKNTTYYTDKAGVLLTRDQKQLLLAPVTIKTYVVPDGVQRIADHAFAERKQMTSVTLPVSMKNIGRSAFARCTQLKTMYYYGSKQQWSGVGKQTDWNADSFYLQLCMDNPSRGLAMKLSADESFYTVTGMGTCTDTEIRIPMAENNIPVTQIAPKAFANQRGITKVVIPESVTKIGASAFTGCDDLEQISYQGTQEQWQSVELGTNWADASVRDVVIDEALSGDFTGDEAVNNEDVAYLLWYTLFPEDYPIAGKADFTGDGAVNNEDVAYLLWHTLFPEDYPL